MMNVRTIINSLFAVLLIAVAGCSLSSDLTKMDDKDDYDAYVKKWAPNEDAFLAMQRIAKPYVEKNDWEGATAVYDKYRSYFPDDQERIELIVASLKAPLEEDVKKINLGPAINSPANDFKPSVSVNGKRMFFASDREGGFGGQDIYVAVKGDDGKWQPAVNLGDKINTAENESFNGMSFDGTTLLIYGGFKQYVGKGDNYYYEKTPNGWSNLKMFPYPVNNRTYDSDGFLTADGKAFIFTSDREGGVGKQVQKGTKYHGDNAGNTDIWVTVQQNRGRWSAPINLGSVINTPYAERTAFLHPDGKTLYFSSDGHPGFGGLDVFKSVRLNPNSWTEWSEPVNLGKQINTPEHDWGYKISTDGRYAFFNATSGEGELGENDIYMVTLPSAARPEGPVALREGVVTDADGNPLDVDIDVQDMDTGEIIAQLRSDPRTGEFSLAVPGDRNIGLVFKKEGYYPESFSDFNGNGNGDGNGDNGDGSGNGNNGNGDGSGNNGDGNGDGSGNNGNGNGNGNGNDDGSGNGNNGNGSDNNGNGNGNGDGSGNNGNGNGDGSGNSGNGNGNNGDGTGDGTGLFREDGNLIVRLKSLEDLKSRRDKWGDLLAQRVNNVFFDFAKWDLRKESFYELDRLVTFLETNPDLRIQIGAHTDSIGSNSYNQDLSEKRAKSVVDYLARKGINKARLVAKGYGETRPEVPNDTEENRQRNRRVEFRIVED